VESISIFERILAGELPCDKVFENEVCLAFNDINPLAKVHILVIPKQKAISMVDIRQWEPKFAGAYFQSISTIANESGLEAGGYRVVFNCGEHGGQTVPYLHAHILGGEQLPMWDALKS
jgi:histidine triad (HIT) family protein